MRLTQSWIGYLDRSYETIKKSVLARLVTTTPELSDHSESNPLIIIVSMFSGIAEMLNLYIDRAAEETYLSTARKYSSVLKLSKLIDYQVKAKNPSFADVMFYLVNNLGQPITYTAPIIIPAGTIVKNTLTELEFRLIDSIKIPIGKNSSFGIVVQNEYITSNLGTSNGNPNQAIALPENYQHNSSEVKVDGEIWKPFISFAYMDASTKGYVVSIEEDKVCYINFGDGINGKIPSNGASITGKWLETSGSLGNSSPNSINQIVSNLTLPSGISVKVNNPGYSTGGADYENIESIRKNSPRSLRTLERAVTSSDYEDIAIKMPGVGSAKVRYCCGKFVDVFIVPSSPGIATFGLLKQIKEEYKNKKMVGTFVDVVAAGVTKVWIKGKVFGIPLINPTELNLQVAKALDDEYGYGNIQINKRIAASEIIQLIENLSLVDHFDLEEIKIIPFARAIENTSTQLKIEWVVPKSTQKIKYQLLYDGGVFQLYKNGTFKDNVSIDTSYADSDIIGFTIRDNNYINGQKWEFTVFPTYPEIFPNTIIQVSDLSGPIVEITDYVDDNTARTITGNITFKIMDSEQSELAECD